MHTPARRRDFTRTALTADSYGGWVVSTELRPGGGAVVDEGPGTYVVYRVTDAEPVFLDANPGGRFKGRDPSVPLEHLKANWVAGAHVVYIGKADNMTVRVRAMAAFGARVRAAHWGGRLVWQLADSRELLFAWRPLRAAFSTALADEVDMIRLFCVAYGRPPFANSPNAIGR
jgi:hypothetical protein